MNKKRLYKIQAAWSPTEGKDLYDELNIYLYKAEMTTCQGISDNGPVKYFPESFVKVQ